jgi:3-isopropylmalate/(R)-2-methylmalate dehydratase small subunit
MDTNLRSEAHTMERFKQLTSKMVSIPIENIDTDQIIPAQFLKGVDKNGLGERLFFHWRSNPEFILNQADAVGARILVAGDNFGCGSSREHAIWALMSGGFQAVISTGFADIFRNNALKNGLLPIVVDSRTHLRLQSLIGTDPDCAISIDLETQTVTLPEGEAVQFPIDRFSKSCIMQGVDQLGYLQSKLNHIETYEARQADRVNTLG